MARPTQPPRKALATPSARPNTTHTTNTPTMMDSETPSRLFTSDNTLSWVKWETPKSPCKALPAQCRYWSTSGRSSPRSARKAWYWASVPSAPRMVEARSPGARLLRKNVKNVATNTKGMETNNRFRMRCSNRAPFLMFQFGHYLLSVLVHKLGISLGRDKAIPFGGVCGRCGGDSPAGRRAAPCSGLRQHPVCKPRAFQQGCGLGLQAQEAQLAPLFGQRFLQLL